MTPEKRIQQHRRASLFRHLACLKQYPQHSSVPTTLAGSTMLRVISRFQSTGIKAGRTSFWTRTLLARPSRERSACVQRRPCRSRLFGRWILNIECRWYHFTYFLILSSREYCACVRWRRVLARPWQDARWSSVNCNCSSFRYRSLSFQHSAQYCGTHL